MRPHPKKGFTLIEMLISVGLFSLLAVLITGSLFYMTNIQESLNAKQQILNDFRNTIDVMSNEIAFGSAFPSNCTDGCNSIIFTTQTRPDLPLRNVEYKYNASNQSLTKAVETTYGICAIIPFDDSCFQPVTSPDVKVASMEFYVSNKSAGQPIITVKISGTVLPGTRNSQDFDTTTSLPPRNLQDPNAVPPTDNVNPIVSITSIDDGSGLTFISNGGDYSTGNATISIYGTQSDNVGVTSMKWTNDATDKSGIISGDLNNPNWSVSGIALKPSKTNDITIEAYDAAGNISNDATIHIQSTAPPPAPPTPFAMHAFVNSCNDPHPTAYTQYVNNQSPDGNGYLSNDVVTFYRCDGVCTPTLSDALWTSGAGAGGWSFDTSIDLVEDAGQVYSYSARLYDPSTDEWGGMSPVVTYTVGPYLGSCEPEGGGFGGGGSGGGGSGSASSTPNFTVDASPLIIKVFVDGNPTTFKDSQTTTLNVTPGTGFTQNIVYSFTSGAPTGALPLFSPSNGTVGSPDYGPARFYIRVPENTSLGNYNLVITATAADGTAQTIPITLAVLPFSGGQQ